MMRIERGIERYWRKPVVLEASGNTYDSADPKHAQHGEPTGYLRAWPVDEALRTLHTTESKGVALPPFLTQFRERERTTDLAHEVLPTVVADGANHALITDGIRGEGTVQSVADPMLTQTTAQTKGILIPVEGREGKVAAPVSDTRR